MTDITAATRTPWTVKALGREYVLSPLRLRSWGALIRFVRQSVIASAVDAATTTDLPRPERDSVIMQATKVANTLSLAHAMPRNPAAVEAARDEVVDLLALGETVEPEAVDLALTKYRAAVVAAEISVSDEAKMLNAILTSPEGLLEIFWLSLLIHHRGLSRDKAEEIIMDMEEDLAEVGNMIIDRSTRGESPKGSKGESGEGDDDNPKESST